MIDPIESMRSELAMLEYLYEDGDREDAQLRQAIRQLKARIKSAKAVQVSP